MIVFQEPHLARNFDCNNRPKRRPHSAAPSYMRATYSRTCAVRSLLLDTARYLRRAHGGLTILSTDADVVDSTRYILEPDTEHEKRACSPARAHGGFGVRTAGYKNAARATTCQMSVKQQFHAFLQEIKHHPCVRSAAVIYWQEHTNPCTVF